MADEALSLAFQVSPQMAEIHPMSRSVLRVLFVKYQRSRPETDGDGEAHRLAAQCCDLIDFVGLESRSGGIRTLTPEDTGT